jgi:hypothetical protein
MIYRFLNQYRFWVVEKVKMVDSFLRKYIKFESPSLYFLSLFIAICLWYRVKRLSGEP